VRVLFAVVTMEFPSEEPKIDFKILQLELAEMSEQVRKQTFAANAARPMKIADTVALVFSKLKEKCSKKLGSLQIMPRYCKYDPDKRFIHANNCFCKIGLFDPDSSEGSLIDPARLANDDVVNFIRSIPQGHALWKAFHTLVVSGTSSFFMAGGNTFFKHWILEFAMRLGLVTEQFDKASLINMTIGKQFEKDMTRHYGTYLTTNNLVKADNRGMVIASGDGLRIPREKRLRFLGHSNDGEIPASNELFELKIKKRLPPSPTIEENYIAQLQQGLLICERWRCRFLTVDRASISTSRVVGREYLVPIDINYLKVLIRRITYGCCCVYLKRMPSEDAYNSLGTLPKSVKYTVRTISM
jgi:hypothetical protein